MRIKVFQQIDAVNFKQPSPQFLERFPAVSRQAVEDIPVHAAREKLGQEFEIENEDAIRVELHERELLEKIQAFRQERAAFELFAECFARARLAAAEVLPEFCRRQRAILDQLPQNLWWKSDLRKNLARVEDRKRRSLDVPTVREQAEHGRDEIVQGQRSDRDTGDIQARFRGKPADFRIVAGQYFREDCEHPAERVCEIARIVNVPDGHE